MKPAKLLKLLYVQVLIGLVLGITVGHYWPEFGAALKPLGDGFVKLVKMMIAPIVFCTIVSGITSLGDSKEIGKTLLKSMGLFYALTIIALLTGLVAVFLLQPGAGMHIDPKHLDASVAAKFANQVPPHGFTEFVLHIIPTSFFGAFAEGEVLPVLLLAVLCGFGLTRIGAAGRAGARGHRRLLAHAVRGLRHHHAARPARRVRRDGVHRRPLRHQVDRLARPADRHVLRRLHLLRRRRARSAGAPARLQAVAADALHPRGAAGRARHLVERAGAAAPAAQARAARLQEGRGRPGAADRLLVQPRRHGDLPDAGVDVHRPGLRHPLCRGCRSAPCWASCC